MIYIFLTFSPTLIHNIVFNFKRTPWTEFVILVYLSTYFRDDNLVQVETYRKGTLITVQRDTTQSILFIILQVLHVSGANHTHHQEYTQL